MAVDIHELKEKYPDVFKAEYEVFVQHACTDSYWCEGVTDDTIEKLDKLGIDCTTDDVRFSGLWCQGDGASFTGTVRLLDFWEAHGSPAEYLVAIEFIRNDMASTVTRITRRSGHYCHENTVGVDIVGVFNFADVHLPLTEGVLAGANTEDLLEQAEEQMEDLTEWVEKVCRGYMRDLYNDLEAEYDYQTSEEVFIEHCEANACMFDVEDEE